jgi:hypothetical protein
MYIESLLLEEALASGYNASDGVAIFSKVCSLYSMFSRQVKTGKDSMSLFSDNWFFSVVIK